MNSQCTHWVYCPLPPVTFVLSGLRPIPLTSDAPSTDPQLRFPSPNLSSVHSRITLSLGPLEKPAFVPSLPRQLKTTDLPNTRNVPLDIEVRQSFPTSTLCPLSFSPKNLQKALSILGPSHKPSVLNMPASSLYFLAYDPNIDIQLSHSDGTVHLHSGMELHAFPSSPSSRHRHVSPYPSAIAAVLLSTARSYRHHHSARSSCTYNNERWPFANSPGRRHRRSSSSRSPRLILSERWPSVTFSGQQR